MAKRKIQDIWMDADACPKAVKELVFRASLRLGKEVTLVANSYQALPTSEYLHLVVVGQGEDVADQYIIDHVAEDDLVITADIPLAAKIVEKKAVGLNPRGEVYTEENVKSILSMRDYMKDLRDQGIETAGPPPFGPKDKQNFANSLSKLLS